MLTSIFLTTSLLTLVSGFILNLVPKGIDGLPRLVFCGADLLFKGSFFVMIVCTFLLIWI